MAAAAFTSVDLILHRPPSSYNQQINRKPAPSDQRTKFSQWSMRHPDQWWQKHLGGRLWRGQHHGHDDLNQQFLQSRSRRECVWELELGPVKLGASADFNYSSTTDTSSVEIKKSQSFDIRSAVLPPTASITTTTFFTYG